MKQLNIDYKETKEHSSLSSCYSLIRNLKKERDALTKEKEKLEYFIDDVLKDGHGNKDKLLKDQDSPR